MKNFSLILIISLFISLPIVSYAQVNVGGRPILGTLADEMSVNFVPTYPKPGESVFISLEMYTEDLNSADIAFFLDGSLKKSGKGLKNFSFTAPKAGRSITLSVKVALQSGASFTKEITVTPAGVEILLEALSYTPPFYKGRALPAPQGFVKLLAVPHFSASVNSMSNNSSLVYEWTIDGNVRQDLGGFGKNTAVVKGSLLGLSQEVEVTATDPSTNVTAQGSTAINPYDPAIVFYDNSPLYGIVFERALVGSVDLKNEEATVLAAPFNVSKENLNSLNYSWRVNGQSAEGVLGKSAIFRRPDGVSGSSNLSLEIANPAKPLQYGKNSLYINFQKK